MKATEGVFAYSRISPDGQFLAYASETDAPSGDGTIVQTIRVVDLQTGALVFSEPGIDAYWSPDGSRMIYLSYLQDPPTVSIRNHRTGTVTRSVAPRELGDYYSWGTREGREVILTIKGNYYDLNADRGKMPAARMSTCDGIGVGERPLLSRDARKVSVFVRGTLVVRELVGCDAILSVGLQGAKADFSADGRYLAFHVPKAIGYGYEIQVVDLEERTVRTVTNLPGSSLFPSWTNDGRLSFRYDAEDFRGFVMANDVLTAATRPLPSAPLEVAKSRSWDDIFPETPLPRSELVLVLVWAAWSAHSPSALTAMQQATRYFSEQSSDVGVMTAIDPGSSETQVNGLLRKYRVALPRLWLDPHRFLVTEGHNQMPMTLLFRGGQLVDRRLGAQTFEEIIDWIASERRHTY